MPILDKMFIFAPRLDIPAYNKLNFLFMEINCELTKNEVKLLISALSVFRSACCQLNSWAYDDLCKLEEKLSLDV